MRIVNSLLTLFIFMILTSMSKCKLTPEPEPQVQTTVNGLLTDLDTGEPLPGVDLALMKEVYGLDVGKYSVEIDSVKTDLAGNFKFLFTSAADKRIYYIEIPYEKIGNLGLVDVNNSTNSQALKLGATNTIELKAKKIITLKVHLINNSDQNRKHFHLRLNCLCSGYDSEGQMIKKDTVINARVPRKTLLKITSTFVNIGGVDEVKFTKDLAIGLNDTTVQIINP